MNATIITVGDEILLGHTLNTNAAYIAEAVSDLGLTVSKTVVLSDSIDEIIKELDTLDDFSFVFITGGLGPTHDDLTRDAIVKFLNTELVEDSEVLDDIKQRFDKMGRDVTPTNKEQALVPKGANIIRNKMGTAPGYWIEKEATTIIVLPGVPHEMEAMLQEYVIPKIADMTFDDDVLTQRVILRTTGIPESILYEKLREVDGLFDIAKLAFLPSPFGVKIRITIEGNNDEEISNKISEVEQKIRAVAGRNIYGRNEDQLGEVVGRLLKERGIKLAVAESCTGGLVTSILTDYSGSSDFLERGIVSYSNAAKVEILQVEEDLLVEHGAVSIEVARQMADGVRSISGTDIGLALTGIMGPTGGTKEKPVGTVIIGLSDENGCTVKKFVFGENRIINKQRAAVAALDMLRKFVLGISLDA